MLRTALLKADNSRVTFTLTVLTSGGMAQTSLALSLAHELDRVIVVILSNSIIEQTARIYGNASAR